MTATWTELPTPGQVGDDCVHQTVVIISMDACPNLPERPVRTASDSSWASIWISSQRYIRRIVTGFEPSDLFPCQGSSVRFSKSVIVGLSRAGTSELREHSEWVGLSLGKSVVVWLSFLARSFLGERVAQNAPECQDPVTTRQSRGWTSWTSPPSRSRPICLEGASLQDMTTFRVMGERG